MEPHKSSQSSQESPRAYLEEVPLGRRITKTISRRFSGQVENFEASVPSMGENRGYPPYIRNQDQYRVGFDGELDPIKAVNWPLRRKLKVAAVIAFATLVVAWGSAAYAPGALQIEERFDVGPVVAGLGVSLYVLGFATGPILWGPLSELYGRKLPMMVSFLLVTAFTFGAASAKDYQSLMLCRFFSGALGAAPLTVGAAALSDMFNTEERGKALNVFTLCIMGGPMISPIVSGYIANSYLEWRWTLYITGIMLALCLCLIVAFQDETYSPAILNWKARELRKRTGNWAIYSELESIEFNLGQIARNNLMKPIVLLVTEPILLLISLYNGFVYGLLYMSLSAVPIIFEGYGWKGGKLYLPYICLFIGCTLCAIIGVFVFEPKFYRDLKKSGKAVAPEARLPYMMFGGVFFSLGIFWLCWTGAYPKHVHWIVPCIGAVFYGFGFIALFTPVFGYIIDSYQHIAASALSGNAFMRGAMGTAFPLFSGIMFRKLGVQWAGTLVGCLSLVMLPVPFLFHRYGAVIRAKSKYAAAGETSASNGDECAIEDAEFTSALALNPLDPNEKHDRI